MQPATDPKSAKVSGMPDAFVILFFVILGSAIITYVLPAGYFATETIVDAQGDIVRTQLQAGSFRIAADATPGVPLFAADGAVGVMNYAFEGLVSGTKWGSAIGVVAFILVVGGAFGIIMATGAVNNGILALIRRTQHAGGVILPIVFILFSLGGAVFGMGEEAIAFCIVLVPLMIALGYDAITAVLITYVATQIGFAASWMNPFSVAIAQGIAEVPLFSGKGFRMILWLVMTGIGLAFTWRYARQIKQQPALSLSFHSDDYFRTQHIDITAKGHYSSVDTVILLSFFVGIAWIIWGVVALGYYIPEIASQFFTIGIAIGVVAVISGRLSMNQVSMAFQQGAKDLLPAALIVGMAKGIVLLLGGDDIATPSVLNTILYYVSAGLTDFSATTSAIFMLLFQAVFNFFVASGSGQAAITMPLMAPLADLVGVSRQIAVLTFQLGDGLTNLIIPTSASLIGCLGVARLDWSIWLKFAWKLVLLLFLTAIISVVIAVAIGLN